MGDYGHVTAWRGVRTGRENQALSLWADALDFYEKAKANGLIDDYDIQFFEPTGGALPMGIITLWGNEDQVDQIARNEDRRRLAVQAGLVLEAIVETRSGRGTAVLDGLSVYQEVLASLA